MDSLTKHTRTHSNYTFQEVLLRHKPIVSKVTAIMQTEQKLRTLRQQMKDNRSKGRELYQDPDHTVFSRTLLRAILAGYNKTLREAGAGQIRIWGTKLALKLKRWIRVAVQAEASTTGAEEYESVIDKTHATELKFAAQVRRHLYHVIVNAFELR